MKKLIVSSLVVGMLGCGTAPESEPATDIASISETIVQLRGDQPPIVVTRTITQAQADEETAARVEFLAKADVRVSLPDGSRIGSVAQADTIAKDLGCAGADMWLYDQTNGGGNRICFSGWGNADLSTFTRGTGTWSGAVRSYWPGVDAGDFLNSCCEFGCEDYAKNQARTNAGTCAQAAWGLYANYCPNWPTCP